MVSVNDTLGIERRAESQWRLLDEAEIDEADRDAIGRFVKHRKIHGTEKTGTYAVSSEETDLKSLRLAAERASVPLLNMGIDDVNELIETLTAPKEKGGYGVTTGIDNYTCSMRVFFRWLHRHDAHGDYPFWRTIKTGNVDFPEPRERAFPSEDDIDAMRRAARGDPRAGAILEFFRESAVRRTLGSQLRLGDLDLNPENGRATFRPNPNGLAQKGVEVKDYPLYEGVDVLRSWANNHHPDPENPEAPLFTVWEYDPDDAENCALSGDRIWEILKGLAEKASLDPEVETKPHAFRHAAVGRWKERGYSLAQVQRRTAWSDRAAAEMWARYGDPDDERIDQRIDVLEGHEPAVADEDDAPAPPTRRTCGNCGARDQMDDHCLECGAPVAPEARRRDLDARESDMDARIRTAVRETMMEMLGLDPDTADQVIDSKQMIEADPEARAAFEGDE